MRYRIIMKQYDGALVVNQECWELDLCRTEQVRKMTKFPCQIQCLKREEPGVTHFVLRGELFSEFEEPVSLSFEYTEEGESKQYYIFLPAAVYDGNRMDSRKLNYPPYYAKEHVSGENVERHNCSIKYEDGASKEYSEGGKSNTERDWAPVITDIPRLAPNGTSSRIQLLAGDMSTPAAGYYAREKGEGMLLLAKHMVHGRYTGFSVEQNPEQLRFSVSCPGVREETKYFFGVQPDGSGFRPACDFPSDDEGMRLSAGEQIEFTVSCYRFSAPSLTEYFSKFHKIRETMESGTAYCTIPFSAAYTAIRKKYLEQNFKEESYFSVGTQSDVPPACWQAGWVGGGMNSYAFLLEESGDAYEKAVKNLHFITEHLQYKNGWYVPMYANGVRYGDDGMEPGSQALLMRKDADLLYFLIKQLLYLSSHGEQWKELEQSIVLQADAMVRFYRKNGELGQFIHMGEERLLQGGTASAAIASAALALAWNHFGKREYLDTAERLGRLYRDAYLRRGIMNGGPGEICQASDSESAFGFLESCVQLYETTGSEEWLQAAKEAFELAITWVVSYDFTFPENSTAAAIGIHSMGSIFANVQNKHAAPGICSLSGNSLLKLYRFTGDEKYLRWLGRISHCLSQFVSLEDRPIRSLSEKNLPFGYMNERVQLSDWEGKETIGEFQYASNWPEVTMMLTWVEVPGIYLDLDREKLFCFDHVEARLISGIEEAVLLEISNDTKYDAVVNLLADHSQNGKALGHDYYARMEKIPVPAGHMVQVPMKVSG